MGAAAAVVTAAGWSSHCDSYSCIACPPPACADLAALAVALTPDGVAFAIPTHALA